MTQTIMKFLQNHYSSKRSGFITTVIVSCLGVLATTRDLVINNHPELAVDLWQSFFIFSSVLGGFVTTELLIKLVEIIKNANHQNNSLPDSGDSIVSFKPVKRKKQGTGENN